MLITPRAPSSIATKTYILWGLVVFGNPGVFILFILFIFLYSIGKSPVPTPIIGIGTGDFPSEYYKINQINSPRIPDTTNPHNMYVLVLMQLGLLGLFSMLSIFYYQFKLSVNSSNKLIRDTGLTLPLLFLVMMFSDSYLLGHFTTLMFVFFSSFSYKDFEKY